jgi:peptidoglycan glycosyltransferase
MDRQIRRLGIAFVVLFAVLFGQIAYVQVVAADRIANDPANFTRQIIAEYQTQRGPILASNSVILAQSVAAPESSIFRYERQYPQATLYGDITGYYSRVFGRTGLEQAMQPYLSGTAPELAASNITDLILGRPKKGGTVVTTIVPKLQEVVAHELKGLSGAVVALDPRTGDVLAMYSTPGLDPNLLSSGTSQEIHDNWDRLNARPDKPLLSKAIDELYLPGSTFKLVTASAALENGYTPSTTIPNPHVLHLPLSTAVLKNFGDEFCNGGSATVTMLEAFEESCNVTFGQIGLDLGADKLSRQAHAYGLCPTLPPEQTTCAEDTIPFTLPWQTGRFPEPAYFADRKPSIALSAVGLDNDLLNPMQEALIASAIANNGVMMEPQLVTEVRDPQGREVKTFDPVTYGRPISDKTAVAMRQMMVGVVERGTGTAAQISGITVAGKTGTATNGPNTPPNAWFTAFAPAGEQDTPRIAVAVIVLDGGNLGNEATGGQVAAPIARAVIEAALG